MLGNLKKPLFAPLALILALATGTSALAGPTPAKLGPKERPARIWAPKDYSEQKSYPLLIGLHGLGSNSNEFNLHLKARAGVDRQGLFLILPDGTRRSDGLQFWNATRYCCDADQSGVDDAGYLRGLALEAMRRFPIDPERVWVVGFSNGGYMAHRLACDNDGLFTGAVSIAGAMHDDEALCGTRTPIRFLQIHGTHDKTVLYAGKEGKYPGARRSAEFWAERNGCRSRVERAKAHDLVLFPFSGRFFTLGLGAETDEVRYADCDGGVETALWSIRRAPHVPLFLGRDVLGAILGFLR